MCPSTRSGSIDPAERGRPAGPARPRRSRRPSRPEVPGRTTTTSLGCCSSFSSPRRISWIGVSSERTADSASRRIALPFAREQPDRVGPGLVDEREQHLGGDGHAGLVIIPGPGRQVQPSGQLGAAVLAEQLLPDLAEPSRDRRLDVDSDFRCFFSGHGAPSRERESLRVPRISENAGGAGDRES